MPRWRPVIVLPPPPGDRWAHRRGEPRVFVLLWTTFLFTATLLTLTGLGLGGYVTPDMYRPAARLLMVTVAAGIAVIWPMIRLSQDTPDDGGVPRTVQDLLIVLLPAQAVIWPQHWLAGWSYPVLLAVAGLYTAWASLVGAALALSLRLISVRGRSAARAPWMLAMIAIAAAGAPAALLSGDGGPGVSVAHGRAAWMLSPATAAYELVRDRSWTGQPAAVYREHWLAIIWTAGVSAPLWFVAARGGRRVTGLH
ncbi:MAG: hypothetical protein IT437_02255 [Phycisphaerales bacterium]|nr:hypothetical protein [Phycisphaerales bacterium]